MTRRTFIGNLALYLKSLWLLGMVPSSLAAAAVDVAKPSTLHYKPLNGNSLRELAKTKTHHGENQFRSPIGLERKRRFWQVMSWKLFHSNKFDRFLDAQPITPVSIDLEPIQNHRGVSVTFLKHASFLINDGDKTLFIDPVFSDIFWFIKDFSPLTVDPRSLPKPDHVLITHGHYDHLDEASLSTFDASTHVISPLGYNEVFKGLNMPNRTRLDWYDTYRDNDLSITLLPSNHWTMRSPIRGPNRSLWGGYLIRTSTGYTIYVSGDSAYFDGFEELGRDYAIDLAIINLGAYEPRWFMAQSHMNPMETVQAFKELKAKKLMIAHWGTFRLGDEPVHFPPEDLRKELVEANLLDRWIDIRHGETFYPVG